MKLTGTWPLTIAFRLVCIPPMLLGLIAGIGAIVGVMLGHFDRSYMDIGDQLLGMTMLYVVCYALAEAWLSSR